MKRWLLIIVSLLVVGALITWRLIGKSNETAALAKAREAAVKAPPPVTVAAVESRDVVQTYVSVGSVESPFSVRLAPKVSGRLDYLQVREGAPVKTGEVIARIDPSQIQAQVSQQQANIAEAQSRLAQAQLTQNPMNVNVTTQIQQQVAAVASARADENQVRQNYNSQVSAARSTVADAQGRVDNATAAIGGAEATIRSAQANVNNAQVRYNRTYDLYKQGFVAAQDVDDAKTTLAVQKEAVDVANGQLHSAQAARDSAAAQKAAAQEQVSIVSQKGKADIAAAAAKTEQARSALQYARSNTAQRPAYVQNLAALRSAVAAAQAQLKNLQSQLSDTILTSPIDGFITNRFVDAGAIVSPSQPVVTVQSIRDVFVNISVPEDVSGHLHVGQTANAVFDAISGRKFVGKITQISPAADPQSRQFPVRITLDNHDNALKPGMFGRVSIVTQKVPGALVVPREAVQRGKAGPTVVVVDPDNVAHRRMVVTGSEDAQGIQIREGVHAGDVVVTLSNTPVKDGQKVKPIAVALGASGAKANVAGGGGASFDRGQSGSGPEAGTAAQPTAGGASNAGASSGSGSPFGNSAPPLGSAASGSSGPTAGATPSNYSPPDRMPNNPPQIAQPTPSSVPGARGSGTGGSSGSSALPDSGGSRSVGANGAAAGSGSAGSSR